MAYDPTCPHCDPASFALKYPLLETERFRVVCDVHPLTEGHILIIPKAHISCAGAFPPQIYDAFLSLYDTVCRFIQGTYGSVSAFEHGIIGQTVFHAHTHVLPYSGTIDAIVPEGSRVISPMESVRALPDVFVREQRYLFVSIKNRAYSIDPAIGKPRFFRDRFAAALGAPERGNWKTMRENADSMSHIPEEIARTERQWRMFEASVK